MLGDVAHEDDRNLNGNFVCPFAAWGDGITRSISQGKVLRLLFVLPCQHGTQAIHTHNSLLGPVVRQTTRKLTLTQLVGLKCLCCQ